jgi:hypothetical protein
MGADAGRRSSFVPELFILRKLIPVLSYVITVVLRNNVGTNSQVNIVIIFFRYMLVIPRGTATNLELLASSELRRLLSS